MIRSTHRVRAVASLAGLTLVGALAGSCIDFGYRVPPATQPDAVVADAGGDGAECTEGPATPSASGPQIALVTLNVDQPVLNVAPGDVVTWTNTDTMVHTVTAGAPGAQLPPEQGGFDSGDIAPSGQWAYRFCTARTAIYFCKTHPNQMNNYRVVVTP